MKILSKLVFFIGAVTACFFLSSCEPETIIETETIVETETITINDTFIVSITDTVFVPMTDTLLIPDEAAITNFILIRHAEISTVGTDPSLTPAGVARAEKLASMLSELELDRVYSTDFNRTMQTAIPTALDQGLTVSTYGGFDHDEVIDDILENVKEGKVLIVGHGNTTPNFLNALTGTLDYPELPEDAFDNLFIVNTKSKGDSEVIHLRY